jgi:hypothetical protein
MRRQSLSKPQMNGPRRRTLTDLTLTTPSQAQFVA